MNFENLSNKDKKALINFLSKNKLKQILLKETNQEIIDLIIEKLELNIFK